METSLIIMIGIGVIILALLIVALLASRKSNAKVDYYALFVMGIVWLPLGIPLKNYGLSVMGLIFMIIGLTHKNEWEENRRHWKDLTPAQKKVKIVTVAILTLILLLGIMFYFLVKKGLL